MRRLTILIMLLALTLVAGCAPAATAGGAEGTGEPGGNKVALINGPTEERLPGLADLLEMQLRRQPDCCAFTFPWSVPVRNQEDQRDMYGVRAPLQAAYLARNLGDRWPVLVGTSSFERTVAEQRDSYYISGQLAVKAQLVDTVTGTVLQTLTSSVYSGSRQQARQQPLPAERQDPLMLELAGQAVAELAPQLLQLLNGLAAR
jgi:hypothetical protein